MPNVASASHQTFARFTLGGVALALGTTDEVRGGVDHLACLEDDGALEDRWIEDVAQGSSVTLRVVDIPDLSQPLLAEDFTPLLAEDGTPLLTEAGPMAMLRDADIDGMHVTVETVTRVTYDDGSVVEFPRLQRLTCTGRERLPGALLLTLTDVEDQRLATLFPTRQYTAADFPDLLESDAGRPVPYVAGTALKIPCVQVTGSAPYRYAVCVPTGATVLAVYRGKSATDARVVDPSEYSTGSTFVPFGHRYIEFATEQRDFDGSRFAIFADVQAGTPYATFPLEYVLQQAGVTLEPIALAAAQTFAFTNALQVDCDFGRDGRRPIREIVEDLLWVLRATLTRNSVGEYVIACDGAGASVAAFNEDAGDDIVVHSVGEVSRPLSVGIRYRPSPRDPGALQNTQTRTVPGGAVADERPRELRYVRSHSVADRCAHYRSVRARLNKRLRAAVYRRTLAIGDVITVTSSAVGLLDSLWRVRNVRSIVGGVEIEAGEYHADLAAYVPGDLQTSPGPDYQPDYSSTPPAAPSGFRITATAASVQGDGTIVARVTCDVVPPAVNWESVWFAAIHNVTGEIVQGQGSDVGGGLHGITLTGLRPGEVYQLKAYAVNAFGVQGVVQGTFDATAIGGSGAATTFTAAGYAALPPDVASIGVGQGTGRILEVSWPAVNVQQLAEYVLERRTGAGAYSEIWRGRARSYIDRNVFYGDTYNYRVKARDTFGNLSANWATSANAFLFNGSVYGGTSGNDIAGDTVASGNRTATSSVSTIVFSGAGIFQNGVMAHGLGRIPIATISSTGGAGVVSSVAGMDATNITVTSLMLASQTSNNLSAGDPHRHDLVPTTGLPWSTTVSVDFW